MDIYISHSTGCVGWDMKAIYEGTNFKLGCRTSRFKPDKDKDIQMLDWDYLEWKKNPEKIEKKHLEIVKDYEIETVMSMDLWYNNIKQSFEYTNLLLKFSDNVLIPVHFDNGCRVEKDKDIYKLKEYKLSYPNANWFDKDEKWKNRDKFPPFEYLKYYKHILGGSPQSQLKHLTTTQQDIEGYSKRFNNIESIDGNQLFNCAIRNGKEWYPDNPYWRNHGNHITNEEKFRNSVKKLDNIIKEIIKCQKL